MEIHDGQPCFDGVVITENGNTRRAKPCPRCTVENFLKRFGQRRLTWEMWDDREEISGSVLRLNSWHPRGANMACLLYGTSNPDNRYNGKTHVLVAMGVEFLGRGKNVRYWNAGDFAERRYESFAESVAEFRGLALIDDLGNEADTFATRDSLDRLLDLRMRLSRPTLVVSSLALHAIEKQYPRFHSRLHTATTIPWDADPYAVSQ